MKKRNFSAEFRRESAQLVVDLCQFGKIDLPYLFTFQRNIKQRRQNIACLRICFTGPPGTGRTVTPAEPARLHGCSADSVAVRIKMTKSINQRCIPIKGSTQAGRIYRLPDIPPENQESYQASSAPDGAVWERWNAITLQTV